MYSTKPFAPSCEENKQVILEAIRSYLLPKNSVLEIASGTGQHAIYFSEQMQHLKWQTSDLIASHPGICEWLNDAENDKIQKPIELNVSKPDHWPDNCYDAIFSANSFHIMSLQNVEDFFKNLPKVLDAKGIVLIYGPFNYNGQFTSDSNARFNLWLQKQNPDSGIKDFEWCQKLAEDANLKLIDDMTMPQNNRILVWQNK